MVRAKFLVESITTYALGYGATIKMRPVYSDDPAHENKKFWDATPSGSIEMFIKSTAAQDFIVGQEYYVDFTHA